MIDETLKMIIIAFKDPEFSMRVPFPPFKAHVNPESYTRTVGINYSEQQAPGSSGAAYKYNNTDPQILKFNFLLDRTGALGDSPSNGAGKGLSQVGVTPDIEHFKRLALNYDGDIHRPRYLKLIWGTLLFDCQLKSLEVKNKMFSHEGLPLRAILKASFVEYSKKCKRDAKANKSSPDLTHVRTVKEGDTLPLMSNRIYGDSKYYLEVARFNGITNFRNLEPGDEISFPPLKD